MTDFDIQAAHERAAKRGLAFRDEGGKFFLAANGKREPVTRAVYWLGLALCEKTPGWVRIGELMGRIGSKVPPCGFAGTSLLRTQMSTLRGHFKRLGVPLEISAQRGNGYRLHAPGEPAPKSWQVIESQGIVLDPVNRTLQYQGSKIVTVGPGVVNVGRVILEAEQNQVPIERLLHTIGVNPISNLKFIRSNRLKAHACVVRLNKALIKAEAPFRIHTQTEGNKRIISYYIRSVLGGKPNTNSIASLTQTVD